jgi:hypothetical protein
MDRKIILSMLNIEDIDPTLEKLIEEVDNLGLYYYPDSAGSYSEYLYIFKTEADRSNYLSVRGKFIKAKKDDIIINDEDISTEQIRISFKETANIYILNKVLPLFKIRLSGHPTETKRRLIQNKKEAIEYIDFEGMNEMEINNSIEVIVNKMKKYSNSSAVAKIIKSKTMNIIRNLKKYLLGK